MWRKFISLEDKQTDIFPPITRIDDKRMRRDDKNEKKDLEREAAGEEKDLMGAGKHRKIQGGNSQSIEAKKLIGPYTKHGSRGESKSCDKMTGIGR